MVAHITFDEDVLPLTSICLFHFHVSSEHFICHRYYTHAIHNVVMV